MDNNHDFPRTGSQAVADRMRELLARAAQDHVCEQRSTGQVIEEVRQRLEGMEWLLREVGERVKPVAELPSLWADVGMIAENVDDALARVQSVLDSNRAITEVTTAAAERMDDLATRLDRLAGTMEAASVRFNRLDKALADLGHRSDLLEHEIGAIAGRIERSLADTAERFEQGHDAVAGRVEGVGGRLDGLDGRLTGLSGRIEGLEGHIQGVDDRIEAAGQRITQLPAALEASELHRKLTDLVNRPISDPADRFDALEKRFGDAVDPLIDEVRARPSRGEVEETLSKVVESAHAEVASRVDMARDEVVKQVGSVRACVHDDVTKRMATVHDGLMKRLGTLEETMLALAEALLRPRAEGTEGKEAGKTQDSAKNGDVGGSGRLKE